MAIPDFLSDTVNAPADFSEALAATSTIITTIRSKLVTTPVSAIWTEPSAGLFKSKVDSSGAFIDVLLTAIDADTLEFRVRDKNGNIICTRRIDIEAAGNTTVEYYWGNYYLVICSRRATPEIAQAYLLDPTALGDTLAAAPNRAVGAGSRNTSGTADSHQITIGNLFAWDNGVSAQFYRGEYRGADGTSSASATSVARNMQTSSGRYINTPFNIFVNQSGTQRMTGALPCCLLVDSLLATDTVRNGPLDGSTTRKIIVLPLTVLTPIRLAIRKPSLDA